MRGSAAAAEIVRHVSTLLARTIQWLVMAYDVEKVVIGGGVANSGDAFLQPILSHFAHLRVHSPLTQMMLPDSKLCFYRRDSTQERGAHCILARQATQLRLRKHMTAVRDQARL